MAARKPTNSVDVRAHEVKLVPIELLKPHPKNPRTHSPAAVRHEVSLIRHYGWTVPILTDEKDTILAGHKRRLAAIEMGLKAVPVIRREGLSEADKLGYVIADNQATFNSPWDPQTLGMDLGELKGLGFEMSLVGFEESAMLAYLTTPTDGVPVSPDTEWVGMPEFAHEDKTAYRSLIVHFPDEQAVERFKEAVGRTFPDTARMIWYPNMQIERFADKAYEDEEEPPHVEPEAVPERSTIEVQGVRAIVREGTSDRFIVDEVVKGNAYRRLKIGPDDTVLDVGLNIGMFSILAAKAGATVHGYEPEPDNCDLAGENIDLNDVSDRVTIHRAAVTGTDEPKRAFSLNLKKNKGAHSLVAKRGRSSIDVPAENINLILREVRPTVVKMDIEGGEYEVVRAIESFEGIRELEMEFHHAHLNDMKTREKYHEVLDIVKAEFPNVRYSEDPKGAWVTLIYCSRD